MLPVMSDNKIAIMCNSWYILLNILFIVTKKSSREMSKGVELKLSWNG